MPNAPKPHRPKPKASTREYDQRRGTASSRGYGTQWNKYKGLILADMIADSANPYCRYCESNEATLLDHAIPPTRLFAVGSDEYRELFEDVRYLVPCCFSCNGIKRDKMPDELKMERPEMWARLAAVLAERGVACQYGSAHVATLLPAKTAG